MYLLKNKSAEVQSIKLLRRVFPAGQTVTLTSQEYRTLQTSGLVLPWAEFVEPLAESAGRRLDQITMPPDVPQALAEAVEEEEVKGAKKKRRSIE